MLLEMYCSAVLVPMKWIVNYLSGDARSTVGFFNARWSWMSFSPDGEAVAVSDTTLACGKQARRALKRRNAGLKSDSPQVKQQWLSSMQIWEIWKDLTIMLHMKTIVTCVTRPELYQIGNDGRKIMYPWNGFRAYARVNEIMMYAKQPQVHIMMFNLYDTGSPRLQWKLLQTSNLTKG